MSVLSRVNWTSQARLDLSQLRSLDAYTAADFRAMSKLLAGPNQLVAQGLYVTKTSGLRLSISVADAFVLTPDVEASPFFIGLPGEPDAEIALKASATQYVEARVSRETTTQIQQAFFDRSAGSTTQSENGQEFIAAVDAQNVAILEITTNETGFTSGSIPICVVVTSSTGIDTVSDRRNDLFRQGTGDAPLATFPFATIRQDSPFTSGPNDVGLTNPLSTFFEKDSTGIANDKGIHSLYDALRAIYTVICEIKGTTQWYLAPGGSSIVSNLSLNTVAFDSIGGNSISPNDSRLLTWGSPNPFDQTSPSLVLATQPRDGLSDGSVEPMTWAASYGIVRWQLAQAFTGITRNYTSNSFTSPVVNDGFSLFLQLQRELLLTTNDVVWNQTSAGGLTAGQIVAGSGGSFTGIMIAGGGSNIGDYIRKESEGYSRYYKVVRAFDGVSVNATPGYVCDATIIAVEVERPIVPATIDVQQYRYFRSRYQASDLLVDTAASASLPAVTDANNFWLGRRSGTSFNFRAYGSMQQGEKVPLLGDADLFSFVGDNETRFTHAFNATETFSAGGLFTPTGFSFRRRQLENRVYTTATNNAFRTYTITGTPTLAADGDQLWAKIDDLGGSLASGSVNNRALSNVWEVIPASNLDNPTRSFDTRGTIMLAERVTYFGTPYLKFADGSLLGANGPTSPDMILPTGFVQGSVLFAGTSGGSMRINQDNPELFWNNTTNRLGLGTNNPTFKLHVRSATDSIILLERPAGGNAQISMTNSGGSLTVGSNNGLGYAEVQPGNDYAIIGNSQTRIYLRNTNNFVGIGPNFQLPLAMLHVSGGNIRQEASTVGNGFEGYASTTHIMSLTRGANQTRLSAFGGLEVFPSASAGPATGVLAAVVRTSGASGFGAQTLTTFDRGTVNVSLQTGTVPVSVGFPAGNNGITSGTIEAFSTRSDGNTFVGGKLALSHFRYGGASLTNGSILGRVQFGGMVGANTSFNPADMLYAAEIRVNTNDTWATGANVGNYMSFAVSAPASGGGNLVDATNQGTFGTANVLELRALAAANPATITLQSENFVGSMLLNGARIMDTSTGATRLWRDDVRFGSSGAEGQIRMEMNAGGVNLLDIGRGRTADGDSYLNLMGSPGNPISAQLYRQGGANGDAGLYNQGTGSTKLWQNNVLRVDINNDFNDFYRSAASTSTVIRLNAEGTGEFGEFGVLDKLGGANSPFDIKNEGGGSLRLYQNNKIRFDMRNDITRHFPSTARAESIIDISNDAETRALRLQQDPGGTAFITSDGTLNITATLSGSNIVIAPASNASARVENALIRSASTIDYVRMGSIGNNSTIAVGSSMTFVTPFGLSRALGAQVVLSNGAIIGDTLGGTTLPSVSFNGSGNLVVSNPFDASGSITLSRILLFWGD